MLSSERNPDHREASTNLQKYSLAKKTKTMRELRLMQLLRYVAVGRLRQGLAMPALLLALQGERPCQSAFSASEEGGLLTLPSHTESYPAERRLSKTRLGCLRCLGRRFLNRERRHSTARRAGPVVGIVWQTCEHRHSVIWHGPMPRFLRLCGAKEMHAWGFGRRWRKVEAGYEARQGWCW